MSKKVHYPEQREEADLHLENQLLHYQLQQAQADIKRLEANQRETWPSVYSCQNCDQATRELEALKNGLADLLCRIEPHCPQINLEPYEKLLGGETFEK